MTGLSPPMRHRAYWLTKANWQLYDGHSDGTITLTGSKPDVSFSCAVTLSVGEDTISGGTTHHHTDVTGSVFVNSEELAFTSATKRTTTSLLTALPTVTTTGLDCDVLIECMDSGGKIIEQVTNTPILIRWEDYTKAIQGNDGVWGTQMATKAYTKNLLISDGAVIKFDKLDDQDPTNGKEWMVKYTKEQGMTWGGKTIFRCLYF